MAKSHRGVSLIAYDLLDSLRQSKLSNSSVFQLRRKKSYSLVQLPHELFERHVYLVDVETVGIHLTDLMIVTRENSVPWDALVLLADSIQLGADVHVAK